MTTKLDAAWESLYDGSACDAAPVTQHNLQQQQCGTHIVMGHYNINLSVKSNMDQSYEFLSDKQRAYNIVIEYMQNMMDWVTTWVNAAVVILIIVLQRFLVFVREKLEVTRGIRSFTDSDRGLMSGHHIRYRTAQTETCYSVTIEMCLDRQDTSERKTEAKKKWKVVAQAVADHATRSLYLVQLGQGMLDVSTSLPIGKTSKQQVSTGPAWSERKKQIDHDQIVPQAGGHGVGLKQLILLSQSLGYALWITGTVIPPSNSTSSSSSSSSPSSSSAAAASTSSSLSSLSLGENKSVGRKKKKTVLEKNKKTTRRVAFMTPEMTDDNGTIGVRGGLLNPKVPLVVASDLVLFDKQLQHELGARPSTDVLVHRIRFTSIKFDMTDVATALRISHIMFDGLSPLSISLNTRDGSCTDEEHGAIIERKRDVRSTIWLNGIALHNVFDGEYSKSSHHPNLLIVERERPETVLTRHLEEDCKTEGAWSESILKMCVDANDHETSLVSYIFRLSSHVVKNYATTFVPYGCAYLDHDVDTNAAELKRLGIPAPSPVGSKTRYMTWLEEVDPENECDYLTRIECFLDIKKYMTRYVLCHANLVPIDRYTVRSGASAWVYGVFRVLSYLEEHREIWYAQLNVGRLQHWRDQPVLVWLNRGRKDIISTSYEPQCILQKTAGFDDLIAAETKALQQEHSESLTSTAAATATTTVPPTTENVETNPTIVKGEVDEISSRKEMEDEKEEDVEASDSVLEAKDEKEDDDEMPRSKNPAKRRRKRKGYTSQHKKRRVSASQRNTTKVSLSSSSIHTPSPSSISTASSLSLSSSAPRLARQTLKTRRSVKRLSSVTPMVLHPAFVRMRTQATLILLEEDLYSGAALASCRSALSWSSSSTASDDAQRELIRQLVGCYFSCLSGCQRDSESVVNFLTHYFLSGLQSSPPRSMPWPEVLYHFVMPAPLCLLTELGNSISSSSSSSSTSSSKHVSSVSSTTHSYFPSSTPSLSTSSSSTYSLGSSAQSPLVPL